MFVSTHWALCVSSSPFRFLLKWFLLWKVEAQRAVMMNVVLMRDSFVAAGLQHAGCGDGDPPPVQLQRGFPGLFLSLSLQFSWGFPFFPCTRLQLIPPSNPSLCLWGCIISPLLPPSAFPGGKKAAASNVL